MRKTVLIILILVTCAVFFGVKYFLAQRELIETKNVLETQNINGKVLEFTKLFIEKVLKAENEIDFETRLNLENAVRDLNDENILSQWQKFTESKTEADAQQEVKNLLEILVSKIKIK
jgi:hypothetical protein